MSVPHFYKRAACRGLNPEIFFVEEGAGGTNNAIRICKECPVRMECLLHAAAAREIDGIWGGVSPRARRPGNIEKTIKRILKETAISEAMKLRGQDRRDAMRKIKETM